MARILSVEIMRTAPFRYGRRIARQKSYWNFLEIRCAQSQFKLAFWWSKNIVDDVEGAINSRVARLWIDWNLWAAICDLSVVLWGDDFIDFDCYAIGVSWRMAGAIERQFIGNITKNSERIAMKLCVININNQSVLNNCETSCNHFRII